MLNNFNYEEDVKKTQNESVVSQLLGELLPKTRQEEVSAAENAENLQLCVAGEETK